MPYGAGASSVYCGVLRAVLLFSTYFCGLKICLGSFVGIFSQISQKNVTWPVGLYCFLSICGVIAFLCM